MLLEQVVEASAAVAGTRSRLRKREVLAGILRAAADTGEPAVSPRELSADPGEPVDTLALVAGYLSGAPRQRRTGVGWRGLATLPEPAARATLSIQDVDAALQAMATAAGPGSNTTRGTAVTTLFGRATAPEQGFLRDLMTGQLRQGSLDSAMLDAVAEAFEVGAQDVRRAAFLGGSTAQVARAAADQWLGADPEALARIVLELGRGARPMLASSAPDLATAWAGLAVNGPVAVDTKLDGIRVQIHRDGHRVTVFSRSLDDITARLPQVVEEARALPVQRFVVDGEVLAVTADGSPEPFQISASRTSRHSGPAAQGDSAAAREPLLRAFLFDLLHLDGVDFVDQPAAARFEALAALAPEMVVERLITDDVAAAETFAASVLAKGHEGVVLKDLRAPYAAGRRGASWVKVKPRHTLDLVVLGVEWGSGRRRGTLSNIHLGARAENGDGFVMVGKTFKGMTDEMLAWQTKRFLELETSRDAYTVYVDPRQVVEIAIDGVQSSRRYPGGVALRFARVLGYRDDKTPDEADSITAVQALLPGLRTLEE